MAEMCDLFKSLKFVYRASRVFAVLPYTMYSSSDVTGITPSHCSYLFSVFTTLVISAHGVTYPFVVVGTEVPCFFCWTIPGMVGTNSTTIALTGYRLQAIAMKVTNRLLISMMSFSALLFALFYASKMPEFVEKLQNSDYYFRVLLSHSKQSVKCCISGKIIVGLMLITVQPTIYYMYSEISRPDLSVVSIIWLIVLMWDNINAAVCEAQFGNYAYLLKVRFRIINNYLINLQQPIRGKCLEENKKHPSSSKEFKRLAHQFNSSERLRPEYLSPPVRLLSIEMCRCCHRNLCDLLEDLNGMFQLMFLSSLSGCFLKVLLILFSMVVSITTTSDSILQEILKRIFWINFYGCRFFALVWFACQPLHEGIYTKPLVAELSSTVEDEKIKKELLLFYNQVMGKSIEFSSCSLFKLNTGLITSAVSVGTTYLVMLIQFHTPGST